MGGEGKARVQIPVDFKTVTATEGKTPSSYLRQVGTTQQNNKKLPKNNTNQQNPIRAWPTHSSITPTRPRSTRRCMWKVGIWHSFSPRKHSHRTASDILKFFQHRCCTRTEHISKGGGGGGGVCTSLSCTRTVRQLSAADMVRVSEM